ncbi:MAG TPA: hypothetical protein PLK77_02910, partial [Pyrinomonadaceae bacterium]|nr:hypothetical protein [Pyrinomonadaceae bacterium]
AAHPFEIAYFDRGPNNGERLIGGGTWSAYWYNGNIYSSEMVRGLDVLELTPSKFMTQNEIDAAKQVRVAELNVQNQQRIVWPRSLTTAKAYVDQLERSNALSTDQVTAIRAAIDKGDQKDLKKQAKSLKKVAGKDANDQYRLKELSAILEKPAK